MIRPHSASVTGLLLVLVLTTSAAAQDPQAPVRPDPDVPIDPLQPEFSLVALPTTLRVAAGRSAFRVTHRFTRALNEGDAGDLLANAFGLDSSAQVGLEFRYGLRPGTQLGVHRTSDRTIQIFGKQNLRTQRDGGPIGLDALATIEGSNNLSDDPLSALGLVVSRNMARAALYAEPVVIVKSNASLLIGLGARVRLGSRGYLVGEFSPRVAGHSPGAHQISVALERRTGGHVFQVNVSNGFGTTLGQIADGTPGYDRWYLGFNIARRFY